MKYNLATPLLLSLAISACGGGSSDSPTLPEDGNDPNNETPENTFDGVPYDYSQYKVALTAANLQQSDPLTGSKSDVVDAGNYANFDNEYFYIDSKSGWLTFEMEGDSNRSELRFIENFKSNLIDTQYRLTAEILPINPAESVANSSDGEEITLLQVHNKGENAQTDDTVLSHPLLRVIWDGEKRSDDATNLTYANAYWAVIKTNALECKDTNNPNYSDNCGDSYDFYYLADFNSKQATAFDIIVRNEQLIINVDNQLKVDFSISYWSHLYSYFKAGAYNQYEKGNSVIQFKTITYTTGDVNDDPVSDLPTNSLDPLVAPASNFDLSNWNLSVPINRGDDIATTIKVAELNDDYQLTDYFWTNINDGGMVFRDYVGGYKTSSGTSYSRTEFREMLRGENTSIDTKGINKNNWVFSNAPSSQQQLAGAIDGNMKATLAVNHVTTTGDASHKGRVIVGQIHAASDEPVRIYYRLLPGHDKGSIYFAHEPSNGNAEQWHEIIGSKSSNADEPEDGIALNEKFSYEIDVVGTNLTVSIKRDDKETLTKTVDMSNSGYNGYYVNDDGETKEDYMYFKAGVYNQNNSGSTSDYVQATFYYLHVTH